MTSTTKDRSATIVPVQPPTRRAVALPSTPLTTRLLTFKELQAHGFVPNRATLANWIRTEGFPPGIMLGPNRRAWPEHEVAQWLSTRPTHRPRRTTARGAR